ncbi:MAG: hypothetical protein ACXACA_07995 [Candidatus Ranarchaeia archaeon]|jgi:uncharacterized membrane protein
MAVVAFSVGSAMCFGVGGVLQKKGVSRIHRNGEKVSSFRKVMNYGLRLFIDPVWFLGGVLSILGWFFYFNALTLGDYLFVRPLLNASLIIGVLGGVLLLNEKVTQVEIGAIGGIAVGAIILGFQEPGGRTLTINPFFLNLTLTLLVIAIILVQFGFWMKTKRTISEIPLSIIAGIIYGLGEIFTNLLAIQSIEIPTANTNLLTLLLFFFSSMTFFMIFLTEFSGFILKQLAFAVGRASVVMPISSSLSIILPIIAAVTVFGEPIITFTELGYVWFALLRPIGIVTIIVSVILLQITRAKKPTTSHGKEEVEPKETDAKESF